jgi:hypothetical protein
LVIELEKTSAKVKAIGAILALAGITQIGDIVRLARSFFGAGVKGSPALVAEIMAREEGDSVIMVRVDTVRYELKKVKLQNIRFQAMQANVDPKLRQALLDYNNESNAAKKKRQETEELLEGLVE